MAGIEDTLHLVIELFLVVEIRIFPVERVTGGGLQVAFACAHANSSNLDIEKSVCPAGRVHPSAQAPSGQTSNQKKRAKRGPLFFARAELRAQSIQSLLELVG